MSLHAVLSAMRTLILDGIEIPADVEARKQLYLNKFQPLSPEELEDLVRIAPEKFAIYTGTVFSGQRATLEMHFPVSIALLKVRCSKTPDTFEIVREMHSSFPWKGYPTNALARSFVNFLEQTENEYRREVPEIVDLARLECLSLEVARGLNPHDAGLPRVTASDLGDIRIGDLLAREIVVPENVRGFAASYDVLPIRTNFFRSGEKISVDRAEERDCCLIAGRDAEQYVRWLEVSPTVFDALASTDGTEKSLTVEDLARAYLEDHESDAPETEVFQEFFFFFWRLEDCGITYLTSLAST